MSLTGRRLRIISILIVGISVILMLAASANCSFAATKPTNMKIKVSSSKVDIKGKVQITVKSVKPRKASKAVTFKSSNTKVATVNKKGVVTGKKKGTVKITVRSKKNKRLKKTVRITVTDLKATRIIVSDDEKSIPFGSYSKLSAKAAGTAGYYNQGVVWSSSNPEIVVVNAFGDIFGQSEGTAVITATEKGGTRKASCTVEVTAGFKAGQKQIKFGDFYWNVLRIGEGNALLITSSVIETRKYNDRDRSVTWSDSEIRQYLNNQFINNHFTSEEIRRIVRVTNTTDDNEWFGTNSGGNTLDGFFLLSNREVVEYFGNSGLLDEGKPDSGSLLISDDYNYKRIVKNGSVNTSWWLRSAGDSTRKATVVTDKGMINIGGIKADTYCGIRPAVWVKAY